MEKRCFWANSSELLQKYHDEEWGKPLHDDRRLFEMLILEGKSCGLSWELILKKRDHMEKVFADFEPNAIIGYDYAKVDELMQDAGIIRHRAKIEAVIGNARAYFEVKKSHGSLDNFLWNYVNYQPIRTEPFEMVTRNELSDRLSKDLKKLGFKFVGSIIIYSIYAGGRNDQRSRAKLFNEKQLLNFLCIQSSFFSTSFDIPNAANPASIIASIYTQSRRDSVKKC